MITHEEYNLLIEKRGKGERLTDEEWNMIRAVECQMNDLKYGREHDDSHLS